MTPKLTGALEAQKGHGLPQGSLWRGEPGLSLEGGEWPGREWGHSQERKTLEHGLGQGPETPGTWRKLGSHHAGPASGLNVHWALQRGRVLLGLCFLP